MVQMQDILYTRCKVLVVSVVVAAVITYGTLTSQPTSPSSLFFTTSSNSTYEFRWNFGHWHILVLRSWLSFTLKFHLLSLFDIWETSWYQHVGTWHGLRMVSPHVLRLIFVHHNHFYSQMYLLADLLYQKHLLWYIL